MVAERGIKDQPSSFCNTRQMSVEEASEEAGRRDWGDRVDTVSEGRSYTVTRDSSRGQGSTKSTESTSRARSHRLSSRAAAFAEKIGSSAARLRGFFGVAHLNKAWGVAVARVLYKQSRRLTPRSVLEKGLGREKGLKQADIQKISAGTAGVVEVWAANTQVTVLEDERARKGDVTLEAIGLDEDIDEASGDVVEGSLKVLIPAGTAAALVQKKCCPICLVQSLGGKEISEFRAEGVEEEERTEGRVEYHSLEWLKKELARGSASWRLVQELARRHNREMHALNGNVVFEIPADMSRVDAANAAVTAMWGKGVISELHSNEPNRLLAEAGERQGTAPMVNFLQHVVVLPH